MIHGLLPCDKERGISSFATVEKARRLLHVKKAGHFGTLDPMATGLLLIGLGHVTKFFDLFLKKEKTYSGVIRLGYATTTFDQEGEPTCEPRPVALERIDLAALEKRFSGPQEQLPPRYSAKKYRGEPLYAYARRGEEAPIKTQQIVVHEFHLEPRPPDSLFFRIRSSSGTYIRSLANDIGEFLGTGGHLAELVRERVGEYTLDQAHSLPAIAAAAAAGQAEQLVIPIESLLPEFAKVIVSPGGRRAVTQGMDLKPGDILKIYPSTDPARFRIFDETGKLLALATREPGRPVFRPLMVFPE